MPSGSASANGAALLEPPCRVEGVCNKAMRPVISTPQVRHTVAMDQGGRQELHYRALEGDVPGIQERLAAGDNVASADAQGFTALHFAAQQSQVDAIAALLAAGAPVDARDRHGNTPLWRAVFDSRGRLEAVRALLEAGADPDLPNSAGTTVRELASRMGVTLT